MLSQVIGYKQGLTIFNKPTRVQDFSRYLQSRGCPSAHVGAYSKSWSLKTWSQPTSPRSSQSLKLHNFNGSPWVNSAKYLTLLSQHCENIVQWSSWLNSDAIWTLLLHLRFTPVLGNHDHFGAWVHLFAISIWSSASLLKKFSRGQQNIASSVHRNRNRLSILPSSADPVEVLCKLSRESIEVYEIVPPCSLTLRLCMIFCTKGFAN